MRHLAELVLGGMFSGMAMLSSCLARETPPFDPSLPDGTVLPYVEPVQACIDAYVLAGKRCQFDGSKYEQWCRDLFNSMAPECTNTLEIEWACNLATLQADGTCPKYWPCEREHDYGMACVLDHGCEMPTLYCMDNKVVRDRCYCWSSCNKYAVITDCKPDGGSWNCGCYVADQTVPMWSNDFLGRCDQGPVCEVSLDQNCCNQLMVP